MSSNFLLVREHMAMNDRGRAAHFVPDGATATEIDRVLDIWNASLSTSPGPFLFGDFSIADCFYAPVLSRFRTYGVSLDGPIAEWAERMWAQPSVAKWTALAETSPAIPKYDELL